jgi:hypothetical protein
MLKEIGPCEGLFHTPTGVAYADILVDGHRETWAIRSPRFRLWLRRRYYEATGTAANIVEIRSALDLLEARAQFDGPERMVNVRVAEHGENIYLDLADQSWRSVEIGPDGWRVIQSPPVRFRRPASMLPITVPERGGSIAALRPRGPYPLLAISGEQGSAKSVLSKMLKALIDPSRAPVRALSREERELMIAAQNGHLLAFDNLSGLPGWISDALCRLATGGSFAVRQLYTDVEEVLFEAASPIILNGIEDVISRPDLGDRAIFVTLPHISENRRRPEDELWREFEVARPRILGALLDAVITGLRGMWHGQLHVLPRMADFALWATACERALWPAGTFACAYAGNRRSAIDDIIETDPLAAGVRELMAERSMWRGTAAELVIAANRAPAPASNRIGDWPRTPRALAGRLRRAQTFLRTVGIQVEFSREGHLGTRIIHLSSAVKTTVSIVSAGACNVSEPAVRIGQSDASLPNNRISILRDADGADAEGSYLK